MLSTAPTQCRIFAENVAIHWFPTYEDGVPCFCGATRCQVEGDETDATAMGYDFNATTPSPEEPTTEDIFPEHVRVPEGQWENG